MKLSPKKTKIVDSTPSPIRTLYDEDIDFLRLNEINKKARDIDENYFEKHTQFNKEKANAV